MTGRPNPYVGPRAIGAGEPLYGRDQERAALLDLLIAERVVLLHAPSGAGKSSLLQAGLVPDLIAEGFAVRPVIRVGMEPPADAPPGVNRYVLSALVSLEEGKRMPAELAGMDLATGLAAGEAGREDRSEVLIFDQFEEVLTADPNNRAAKAAFFAELGAALRSPRRWAVLAMREDYVASLSPYARAVPTRLKAMFRLDLLDVEGATQAARRPAERAGIGFTDAAVRRLIDDLRQVKIQRADGGVGLELGPYVEPVQLQVVCRNLWARLPEGDVCIETEDIAAIGDVDAALTEFYDTQVAAVAGAGEATERAIRAWFGEQLISEHGLRGQVLHAAERSAGLANPVIARLIDVHLVRAEKRRGMTWFELAHDRMIAPVRASNARWIEANLSATQRQAELWDRMGRPDTLLLRDPGMLARAMAEMGEMSAAASDPTQGGERAVEAAFVVQSQKMGAREAAEAAQQAATLRQQELLLVQQRQLLHEQRVSSRQRRLIGWGVIAGLLGALVVLTTRYQDLRDHNRAEAALWAEAERATQQVQARRIAAELVSLPDTEVRLAALLAVAASRLAGEDEALLPLRRLRERVPQAFDPHRLADVASMQAAACRLAGREITAEEWARHVGSAPPAPVCPQAGR